MMMLIFPEQDKLWVQKLCIYDHETMALYLMHAFAIDYLYGAMNASCTSPRQASKSTKYVSDEAKKSSFS